MIRKAEQSDIARIRALMQSVPGFWSDDWRADALERALESANGMAFVWEEESEILGFVCAHDIGFRAYLSELIVAENSRGRGIGKQLIRQIEAELTSRGCEVLISDVWREAEGFYRKLEWEPPEAVLIRRKLSGGRQ